MAWLCQMAAVRVRRRWGDADAEAFEGASAVLFQVQLACEGVVRRFDELVDGREQRFARVGLVVGVGRPDQPGPALAIRHLPLVDRGVGQRPYDR